MGFTRKRLVATFAEAEALSVQIRQMERDSEGQKTAIYRWAVLGDEVHQQMLAAEEELSPVGLLLLKAEINGQGQDDRWAHYREGQWRLPQFGGPGPGDDPPPRMRLGEFLQ